jgi:hypothetical protein
LILFPALSAALFEVLMLPIFIAELSMSLWLIIKGVNIEKWKALAT